MLRHGLNCPDNMVPGVILRFPGSGKGTKNEAGWVIVYENGNGAFGDYSQGLSLKYSSGKQESLSDEELKELRRKIQEDKAKRQAETEAKNKEAAEKARVINDKADGDPAQHPYTIKKGNLPFGSRVKRAQNVWPKPGYEDSLIVPLYDLTTKELCSLIAINPMGDKDLLAGGRKKGCGCPVGKVTGATGTVYVGEGIATIAAVCKAMDRPGVIAGDVGNLLPVAEAVRQLAPDADIIIIADDDPEPGTDANAGRDGAEKAARAIGARVAIPNLGKKADAWDDYSEKGSEGIRAMVDAAYQVAAPDNAKIPTDITSVNLDEQPENIQKIRSALDLIPADSMSGKHTASVIVGWALRHNDSGIPPEVGASLCSNWDQEKGGKSLSTFTTCDPGYNLTNPVTVASIFALAKTHGWVGTGPTENQNPEPWFKEALKQASASRFLNNTPPDLEWIFKGTLLARTTGMLVGPGAAGKSTFAILMLIAAATGRDILPGIFTPTKPGKALGVFGEDDETILHHRFHTMAKTLFKDDKEALDLLCKNLLMVPTTGKDVRFISLASKDLEQSDFFTEVKTAVCEIENLRLIILDPVSRFHGAEENDNGAGTFLVSLMERIAQKTGAAVIFLHHVGKKSGMTPNGFDLVAAMHQDASRGASGLTNGVRWQCNLSGLPEKECKKLIGVKDAQPGQYLAVKVSKKNYGLPEDVHYLERHAGGLLRPFIPTAKEFDQDLEETIKGLVLDAVLRTEDKQVTRRVFIDGHHQEWKKENPRITRPAIEQAIASCILRNELFERNGKSASGRSIVYLSCYPDPTKKTEPISKIEVEIEVEELEVEKCRSMEKSESTLLNHTGSQDKIKVEIEKCRNDRLQIVSPRNCGSVEVENVTPYGGSITPSTSQWEVNPLQTEEEENAEYF